MTESIYQRVLGADFAELSPELQPYFGMPPAGFHGEGSGVYEEAGPRRRAYTPLFARLAVDDILFGERGTDIAFTIANRPHGENLRATRACAFRQTRTMRDELRVVDGRLVAALGSTGRWEIELSVAVVDGGLEMVSTGVWLRSHGRRMRLPRLLAVRVAISERIDEGRHRVEVTLWHPLLGEVFAYRGTVDYAYVAD